MPRAAHVSLALTTFFPNGDLSEAGTLTGPYLGKPNRFRLSEHPTEFAAKFESKFLSRMTRTPGSGHTKIAVKPLEGPVPIVRCDIVNMTRHVHHHFDYARDGHQRKYTMHVERN